MPASAPTLLVTGGAGFIGSSFVALCVQRGWRVVVLDALTYAGHRANLEWIMPENGGSWELVIANICDRPVVAMLLRDIAIDYVVNFAAESHVDNSISGPKAFIDTNIHGSFQLLEACREHWNGLKGDARERFRYLQVSTDEVYGSLGPTGKFSEESPLRPNSPYSASKAAGDHLVRAWHETYGMPTLTTHCTNNYGPRQHPEKLIPHMIACALAGEKLPVYGDGKNVRDWIHVEDHCAGVMLALEKGTPGEAYDFGGNAETENLTLVHALCELLDARKPKASGSYKDQIAFVRDRPGHDRRYAIDDSKSQKALGFTRKYKLDTGLAATVDWYLSNQAWCRTILEKR